MAVGSLRAQALCTSKKTLFRHGATLPQVSKTKVTLWQQDRMGLEVQMSPLCRMREASSGTPAVGFGCMKKGEERDGGP